MPECFRHEIYGINLGMFKLIPDTHSSQENNTQKKTKEQ